MSLGKSTSCGVDRGPRTLPKTHQKRPSRKATRPQPKKMAVGKGSANFKKTRLGGRYRASATRGVYCKRLTSFDDSRGEVQGANTE